MKKQFGLLLLLILFGASSNLVFSQKRGGGGTTPTITLTPTITHATCFDETGDVSFLITVSTGWVKGTKVNQLNLYDEFNNSVYNHPNTGSSGTITNLSPGMYTFIGSVTVKNSSGMWISVLVNVSIWVGIEAVWSEFVDMVATPNSYSAKRDGNTQTYGGVRSSNGIYSGDGWIEMKAQYGTTIDNRVFWLIGENSPLGTFTPSSNLQYIEFYKGSSGNGIKINYEVSPSVYGVASLSTNENDKIRLVRTGSSLTIQKNDDATTIFTLPLAYSGSMNIAVHSLAQNDGCLDVVSSFDCIEGVYIQGGYSLVQRKLDGGYSHDQNGELLISYTEEYSTDPGKYIAYRIYDNTRAILDECYQDGTSLNGNLSPVSHNFGQNDHSIFLGNLPGMVDMNIYTLELSTANGEKRYLRFQHHN